MIERAVELVGAACLVVGTLFAVIGGVGILRLPDLFTRMHGAGITDTLGAGLVLLGLALHAGPSLAAVKVVMVLFFLLVTSPTATHALARAALSRGVRPKHLVRPEKTVQEGSPSSE
jgi:multicomponent Na+:H+ antiporter subunit G